MKRCRLLIQGQVQGVGFRPLVYCIARQSGLSGWVQNTARGVLIEIQGQNLSSFEGILRQSLPPLAVIHSLTINEIDLNDTDTDFQILDSEGGLSKTLISPDTAICPDCLVDLFNPQSRYFQYPFINCTQCGPRFTITRALPYDRRQTAMADFPLCQSCQADYSDQGNRRYHAQPTACAQCGPQLSASLEAMVTKLQQGEILAVKGLGGYQLICDAYNTAAVSRLRERKQRKAKPLAVMVLNSLSAEKMVHMNSMEKSVLETAARPIVLMRKKENHLADNIAPGLSELGIMLASTGLHYLLFHALAAYPKHRNWLDSAEDTALVVTSANLSGQPLITEDHKAQEALKDIADVIVSYNRKIVTRADDSVLRVINDAPAFIRRARGYCPTPIKLAYAIPPTLALGAHLKNTFCITRDDEAFVSQYIGSMNNKETIEFFHESLAYWQDFLAVDIERVACDLHPDFYSSRLSEQYGKPVTQVQHHHAHLAAVFAEHQITEPAIGLALDGYGYAKDQSAWGGELLLLDKQVFERLGSFSPLPLPGGDRVSHEPWRMAAAVLHSLGAGEQIIERFAEQPLAADIAALLNNNHPFTQTSSCGRWFDAASALLGLCPVSQYEGQAAMLLESLVTEIEVINHSWSFDEQHFDLSPVFNYLLTASKIRGANMFHGSLITGLSEWLLLWSKKTGIKTVLLSGGCFLNTVLTEGLTKRLREKDLKVYLSRQLPPNDSGISLGQAWIAGQGK